MFNNFRLGYEIRRIVHIEYLKRTWDIEVRRKLAYYKYAGHIQE